MARLGRPLSIPRDLSVTDLLSLGVLATFYPSGLVDEVLRETERLERRKRLLPSRVVVYYVIAMALYGSSGYREIFRLLVEGLRSVEGIPPIQVPQKSAISKARERVGSEPLKLLFDRCSRPIGAQRTRGAWYRKWRLMSMDGSTIEVSDTPANEKFFGRPKVSRGEKSAFPRLRWVGLGECGTHAVVAFNAGPYSVGEGALALPLLEHLCPGMLCMCDRYFFSYERWKEAKRAGADLLWRVKKNAKLIPDKRFSDGSYLSRVYPSWQARRAGEPFETVRVIDYRIEDDGRPETEPIYRLITTILDPDRAPGKELAELYAERWEVEIAIGEIKRREPGSGFVLRSKKPDGVLQELYGHMLVHTAVRKLMHQAALCGDIDPDRLSYLHSKRVVRRKLSRPESFSPQDAGLDEARGGE